MEFNKGDIVSFGGIEGVVNNTHEDNILVQFNGGEQVIFYKDGKFLKDQLYSVLTLVKRPKLVKKHVVIYQDMENKGKKFKIVFDSEFEVEE